MTTPTVRRLAVAETAVHILQSVERWYADEANNAEALPDRRYVAPGEPRTVAWDCSAGQVTVALEGAPLGRSQELAGRPQQSPNRNAAGAYIRQANYELQIVRPTPGPGGSGQPPSVEKLYGAGLSMLEDYSQVLAWVAAAQESGEWLPEGHGPAQTLVSTVESLGPAGLLTAIAVRISVTLL